MPAAMPLAKKLALKGMLEIEMEHKSIAVKLNCTERHVRKIKKNIIDYDTVQRSKAQNQSSSSKIIAEMKEICVIKFIQ